MEWLFALHAAVAVVVVRAIVRGRTSLLWWCGFLFPLSGLVFSLGVTWSWTRLMPAILLMGLMVHGGRRVRYGWAVGLVVWAGVWTTAFTLLHPEGWTRVMEAADLGWGPGQTEYRHVAQMMVFSGNILACVFASQLVRTAADRTAGASGLVAGSVASVSVGIWQCLGLPWLNLGVDASRALNGNLAMREHLTRYDLGPIEVSRLYGLGGEPKHTAAFCVLAVALVLTRGDRKRALTVLLVGLALTFSTSGWVAMLCIGGLMAVTSLKRRGHGQRLARVAAVIAAIVAAVFLYDPGKGDVIVTSRMESRLANRDTALKHEPKEAAFYGLMMDRPELLLFGLGVGVADFWLLDCVDDISRFKKATVTPTYTLSRTLAELGLVGVCLLGGLIASLVRRVSPEHRPALLATALILPIQPTSLLPAWLFVASTLGTRPTAMRRAGVLPETTRRQVPAPPVRMRSGLPGRRVDSQSGVSRVRPHGTAPYLARAGSGRSARPVRDRPAPGQPAPE